MRSRPSSPMDSTRGKLNTPDQPFAERTPNLGSSMIHAHMMRRPRSSRRLSGAKNAWSTQLIMAWDSGWNCSSFHVPT